MGGWGTHAVSINGTTIYVTVTSTGPLACNGTDVPGTVTLDVNVLSWSAGTGGAVRVPTKMQGTYDYSSPAADGCKAGATQQVITYG
jgi:hypothetical protein